MEVMSKACPRCHTPLPRVRKPTSFRQMMWGGWTCRSCGAELNGHQQLISGRVDSSDGIRVALQPPGLRRSRVLVTLGGFVAPTLGVVGLLLGTVVGPWMMLASLGMMGVLMLLGMIGIFGVMKNQEATLTAASIQWGDQYVRPDLITGVHQEGRAVILHTDARSWRLEAIGDPVVLLEAIEEVRQLGRDTGTKDDVPSEIRQFRQESTTTT